MEEQIIRLELTLKEAALLNSAALVGYGIINGKAESAAKHVLLLKGLIKLFGNDVSNGLVHKMIVLCDVERANYLELLKEMEKENAK